MRGVNNIHSSLRAICEFKDQHNFQKKHVFSKLNLKLSTPILQNVSHFTSQTAFYSNVSDTLKQKLKELNVREVNFNNEKTNECKNHKIIKTEKSKKEEIDQFLKLAKEEVEKTKIHETLTDTFSRHHNYLRISLTERCNLRCLYCMPEEGVELTPNEELLTSEEIIRIVRIFASEGVNKIRFTGGEPLVRKDIEELIREISKIEGIQKIGMTTNGITLARKLPALKEAGLNLVNISLDTLQPDRFLSITRRNGFDKVQRSIESALDLGFNPVKINCVVMRGMNDDEILNFVDFTKEKNIDVRFIEYMPFDGNNWVDSKIFTYHDMVDLIRKSYPHFYRQLDDPNDTSKAWRVEGHKGTVSFITSMTENFCSSCNRLRITADGNLKVCLFGSAEVSLRDVLRNNYSDDDLKLIISCAVKRKKARHAGMHNLVNLKNRPMILIGG